MRIEKEEKRSLKKLFIGILVGALLFTNGNPMNAFSYLIMLMAEKLGENGGILVFLVVLGIFAALLMVGAGMLVSNQFAVGAYVIATPSMTGELNIGDTAIYVEYDDQLILEGQVIVFEKNGMVTIHRVVDIQNINGANRYFTQGDANSERDSGYIFDSDIIGLVNYKIPWIGYPTLWVRSLFGE